MSAFVCNHETIRWAVEALRAVNGPWLNAGEECFDLEQSKECDRLGAALIQLNERAVYSRYGEKAEDMMGDSSSTYRHSPIYPDRRELIQAYKCLQCLRYQCSEGDIDDESTPLYRAMSESLTKIAHKIVEGSTTYNQAHWGMPDDAPKQNRRVSLSDLAKGQY